MTKSEWLENIISNNTKEILNIEFCSVDDRATFCSIFDTHEISYEVKNDLSSNVASISRVIFDKLEIVDVDYIDYIIATMEI